MTNPQEFVRLCNCLLIERYGSDFLAIDDDRGDRGNDGYLKAERRMFAMHCFKRTQNQGLDRMIRTKMVGDLGKATALKAAGLWDVDAWTFVSNYPIPEAIAQLIKGIGDDAGIDVSWEGPDHIAGLLHLYPRVIESFPELHAPALASKLDVVVDQLAARERAPHLTDESVRLCRDRPPAWEWMLFAEQLRFRRQAVSQTWNAYSLGLRNERGTHVSDHDAIAYLNEYLAVPQNVIHNLNRLFEPATQEAAFGRPGEPGNEEAIVHLASSVIEGYSNLLQYALDIRSARVSPLFAHYFELIALFVDAPVRQVHSFVDNLSEQLVRVAAYFELPEDERAARGPLEITLDIDVAPAPGITKQITKESRRVRRRR